MGADILRMEDLHAQQVDDAPNTHRRNRPHAVRRYSVYRCGCKSRSRSQHEILILGLCARLRPSKKLHNCTYCTVEPSSG